MLNKKDFSNGKEIYTISNLLSFFRLLLALPLWFLLDNLYIDSVRYAVVLIGFIAAGTDFLDGYLARKYGETTVFGKIIDPLADKIIVGIVVVKLFLINQIPEYFFIAVIGRDVIIFIGGIIFSGISGKVLASNILGKITVTIIALVILLIVFGIDQNNFVFIILYYLSLILILSSLITYIVRAIEFIKQGSYGSI
jgi:CDP-diacylglycerol--glycerol-3-phosphate 3-phosphatidyltransferase